MRQLPLLAALLLGSSAFAQEPAPRPRLGLVLSGGGARGLAHIGVLQVMEELRVPVDCVSGTSMGSIIGGLYSYGYDPYEIERIVLALDWGYLLQDSSRRTDLSIRRKQEEYEFQIKLRLGIRDGAVALPKGLIQGQNLGVVLDQLLLDAHDMPSFDGLKLPFRCVAADIGDGTRIVFDAGDLPRALRASMALPSVFAPVEWRGRMLVDGGIIDNLPVDAARAMGAERLIAVDIGTPPMRPEEIQNLLHITSQMVALLTQKYIDRALETLTDRDVLIQPQLGDITSADFGRGVDLIALGREWAMKGADNLRKYSVSEEEFEKWRAKTRRVAQPPRIVASTEVVTTKESHRIVVDNRIEHLVGKPLDLVQLQRALEEIHGLDLFELVRCRVRQPEPGQCVLEVSAIEKSWGPGFLMFGMDGATDFSGGDSFSIGTRYVLTDAGPLGAEWATDIRVGTDTLLQTEWFQPLSTERAIFVAPRIGYRRRPLRAPVGPTVSEFTVEGVSAALDLGTHFIPNSEIRVGVDRGIETFDVVAGVVPPGDDKFDDGGLHADIEFDTLDRSTFPTSGVRTGAEWRGRSESLGAEDNYQVARIGGVGVTTMFGQSVALRAYGQWELDGPVSFVDFVQIGGLFELTGLGGTDLVGAEGGSMSLITYRPITPPVGKLSFPVYVGASFEVGGVWDWGTLSEDDVVYGGSVFIGIDSPLGPTFLAYGVAEGGQSALNFSVGRVRF